MLDASEDLVSLPETNSSHLKIGGWKMNFLLGPGLFSGAFVCCSFSGVFFSALSFMARFKTFQNEMI